MEPFEWLDTYVNTYRIAKENHEHMRKWLLKIPIKSLLKQIKMDYVENIDHRKLLPENRQKIQNCIDKAIIEHDLTHLAKAYSLGTPFCNQLNRDLARLGSDFRFESSLSPHYKDDEPPTGLGQYLFTALLFHDPSLNQYQHTGVTFRGMCVDKHALAQYVPGACIMTRSLHSSSKNMEMTRSFMGIDGSDCISLLIVYRITQASTSLDISNLSQFDEEDEVLIAPFAAFRVVKVEHYDNMSVAFLDEVTLNEGTWELTALQAIIARFIDSNRSSPNRSDTTVVEPVPPTRADFVPDMMSIRQSHIQQPTTTLHSLNERYSSQLDGYLDHYHSLHSNVRGTSLTSSSSRGDQLVAHLFDPPLCFTDDQTTQLQNSLEHLLIPLRSAYCPMIKYWNKFEPDMDGIFVPDKKRIAVVLGETGSGKTTYLKWLTFVLARAFRRDLTNRQCLPVFIYLSEVLQMLNENLSYSFLDCLCRLAWMNDELFIRDYITNGHTLILLDGLDEIPSKYMPLIRLFVYECATLSPVIITSRHSQLIEGSEYRLETLTKDAMLHFCADWLFNVSEQLVGLGLSLQSIEWEGKWRTPKLTEEIEKYLVGNLRLLVALSTLALEKSVKRIDIFDAMSASMINAYRQRCPKGICREYLVRILSDLALHMTQYLSNTHSIEEFDIRGKCRNSLKVRRNDYETRQMIDDIARLLAEDVGLLVLNCEHDRYLYKFRLSVFEEYFACQYLIRPVTDGHDRSVIEMAERCLYYMTMAQFREPLLLAVGWISSPKNESAQDIDLFFDFLMTAHDERLNQHLPLGALLLTSSINEMKQLPSDSIIYRALDQLTKASIEYEWFTHFPVCVEELLSTLNNLPCQKTIAWLTHYFLSPDTNAKYVHGLVQIIIRVIDHTRQVPSWIDRNSFCLALNKRLSTDDEYDYSTSFFPVDRCLNLICILDCEMMPSPSGSLREYLLARPDYSPIQQCHPTILATIIALYGGLHRYTNDNDNGPINVIFSPKHMHRDSPILSPVLIRFFENRQNLSELRQFCETKVVEENSSIDLIIAWFCLGGLSSDRIWQRFSSRRDIFVRVQRRFQRLIFYLSECYHVNDTKQLVLLNNEAMSILRTCHQMLNETKPTLFWSMVRSMMVSLARLTIPAYSRSLFDPKAFHSNEFLDFPLAIKATNCIDLLRLLILPFRWILFVSADMKMKTFAQVRNQTHPMLFDCHSISYLLALLPDYLQLLYQQFLEMNRLSIICLLIEVLRYLLRQPAEPSVEYSLLLSILRWHYKQHNLDMLYEAVLRLVTNNSNVKFLLSQFDALLPSNRTEESMCPIEEASPDLNRYISAITLAATCVANNHAESFELQTLADIKDRFLRLHALTIIWQFAQTINKHENPYQSMADQAEFLLSDSVLLEDDTFLYIHWLRSFWTDGISPASFMQQTERLIRRFETNSDHSLIALLCQSLLAAVDPELYPSLRSRIFLLMKDKPQLQSVLQFNATPFASIVDDEQSFGLLFSTSYLMQLSVDVHTLSNWFNESSWSISHLISTMGVILPLQKAKEISRWLVTSDMISENLYLLEQKLRECELIAKDAYPFVEDWLQYADHQDQIYQYIAYHASLHLAADSINAFKLCYRLLSSQNDYFRSRAHQKLQVICFLLSKLTLNEFIDVVTLCRHARHEASVDVYETMAQLDLRIDTVDHLQLLLKWERERIRYYCSPIVSTDNNEVLVLEHGLTLEREHLNVSLLQYYAHFTWTSSNVVSDFFYEHIMQIIESNSSNQQDEMYLLELLLFIESRFRSELNLSIQDGIEARFFGCLARLTKHRCIAVAKTAASIVMIAAGRWATIARNLILDNTLKRYPHVTVADEVLEAIIRDYYWETNQDRKSHDDEELWIRLMKGPSAVIAHAAAVALLRLRCCNMHTADFFQIFSRGEKSSFYHALMSLNIDMWTWDFIGEESIRLLSENNGELLPLFISELFQEMQNFPTHRMPKMTHGDLREKNHLRIAVCLLPEMTHILREQISIIIGENIFKQALYRTSQQPDAHCRRNSLRLVVEIYGELTKEVVEMFLYAASREKMELEESPFEYISKIQRVASRSVIDTLLTRLKSESLKERHMAAYLLVRLAQLDQISTRELQIKLAEAIDDPTAKVQGRFNSEKQEPLAQALFGLLLKLSFVPAEPKIMQPYLLWKIPYIEGGLDIIINASKYTSCVLSE